MRNALLFSAIFLLLAGLGTFAWVSNNPESPQLERAQDWPVVGGLARAIREAYLGPRTAEDPNQLVESSQVDVESVGRDVGEDAEPVEFLDLTSNEPKVIHSPKERSAEEQQAHDAVIARLQRKAAGEVPVKTEGTTEPVGDSSPAMEAAARPSTQPTVPDPTPLATSARSPLPLIAQEWRWFLPGQPVMDDSRGSRQDRLSSLAYLPVLSRDGSWLKVRYHGADGWVDTTWKPEHSRRGSRRGILRERANPTMRTNREDLDVGKKLLGVKNPWGEIGEWDLYTDVEDDELLELLTAAAEHTEDAFFARYGRVPSQSPTHAVLLFAKDPVYREFANETAELPLAGHRGFASQGLVAISAEGLKRRQIASVLVHELTHLLVRRSLGWQLPSWLNEGMASDLGSVWVEDSSDLVLDRLVDDEDDSFVTYHSRLLFLDYLATTNRLPTIQQVLARRQSEFYRGATSYAQSAAFIRYALDGEDGQMAAGFLEFLDLVAKGKRADLLELLGRDLPQLEEGFRTWLAAEAKQKREDLERRFGAGRSGSQ